jgi:CheY-like chemotaxis protein
MVRIHFVEERAMLLITLCATITGLVCGLFLLHWFALADIALVMSAIFLIVMPWDGLLIPKLFVLLTAFQLAYLAGAGIALCRGDAQNLSDSESRLSLDGERVLIV